MFLDTTTKSLELLLGSAVTTKLLECQHVEIVQNSYPTTGADDVYITASTVI